MPDPDDFGGIYPGGPQGEPGTQAPRRRRYLRQQDINDRVGRHLSASRRRQRRLRLTLGFVIASAVAGGLGWVLGRQAQATHADLTARAEAQGDEFLTGEVDRVLRELWRMEALERIR